MESYFVELVSYEKDGRTIKDSHEVNLFDNLVEATDYFDKEVSRNDDKNYGYILGIVYIEYDEDGNYEVFDTLEIISEQ